MILLDPCTLIARGILTLFPDPKEPPSDIVGSCPVSLALGLFWYLDKLPLSYLTSSSWCSELHLTKSQTYSLFFSLAHRLGLPLTAPTHGSNSEDINSQAAEFWGTLLRILFIILGAFSFPFKHRRCLQKFLCKSKPLYSNKFQHG